MVMEALLSIIPAAVAWLVRPEKLDHEGLPRHFQPIEKWDSDVHHD
jgi:hypothetical protein